MKKVIWGGFCLTAGILLFWMSNATSADIPDYMEFIFEMLALILGVSGLALGFIGLKKD